MDSIIEDTDLDPSWMREDELKKKMDTINAMLKPLDVKLAFNMSSAYDKYDE